MATVAPLTATVLADADENNAGIASGVNNAIARIAGLLCVAALGAVVSAVYVSDMGGKAGDTLAVIPGMPASVAASVHAFHVGMAFCAVLVAAGGVLGLVGIRNPRRDVRAGLRRRPPRSPPRWTGEDHRGRDRFTAWPSM